MDLADHFAVAVQDACETDLDGPELLPMVLAQACVAVLPVEGAGLSMTDELRIPLGASDELAATAERLQITLGEGPCLAATASSSAMVFDLETIARRWPLFHSEVLASTPFRSAASVPLRSPDLPRFGALDLYSTRPDGIGRDILDEVDGGIADAIAAVLFAAPTAVYQHGITLPRWLNVHSVTYRMNVWVAVGMLMEHADVSNPDALAVLRAYAFGHSATLDDVAKQVTSRRLAPKLVLGAVG